MKKNTIKRIALISICIILLFLIIYCVYFIFISYKIIHTSNNSISYSEFKKTKYSKYIKDEFDYDRIKFYDNEKDCDINYYGLYCSVPWGDEVTVYYFYIYDKTNKNGEVTESGGSLHEPIVLEITYTLSDGNWSVTHTELTP